MAMMSMLWQELRLVFLRQNRQDNIVSSDRTKVVVIKGVPQKTQVNLYFFYVHISPACLIVMGRFQQRIFNINIREADVWLVKHTVTS